MWGNRVITINTGTGDEEGVCCSQPHDNNEKEAVRSKQERWLLALLSQEGVLAGTRRAGSTDGTPGSDGVMSGPTRTVPAPHAWRGGAFRSVARTASDHGQHRWLCAGPSVVDGRGHCPCLAAWECVAYICSMNVITLLFPSQAEPALPRPSWCHGWIVLSDFHWDSLSHLPQRDNSPAQHSLPGPGSPLLSAGSRGDMLMSHLLRASP